MNLRNTLVESLGEAVIATKSGRNLFAAGACFGGPATSLWAERVLAVTGTGVPPSLLLRHNRKLIEEISKKPGTNPIRDSYSRGESANETRSMFKGFGTNHAVRLRYPRENDFPERQGDLVILKAPGENGEKGVILITYNEAFERAAAMFNLERMAEHYRFVLEPSFWGYQNPAILLFLNLNTDVIIQCPSRIDYDFIKEVGRNFIPIRVGAGDWVDEAAFPEIDPTARRDYDLIMVANWLPYKRHRLLFQHLTTMTGEIKRVALVGYPTGGYTREHIERDAEYYAIRKNIDIFEQIPFADVLALLRRSKVAVMLTRREGANRAFYEALFSDVPVIVTKESRGMNWDHVNSETGCFTDDNELANNILKVHAYRHLYHPRAWALKNTGARRSSTLLNEVVRQAATSKGEPWTVDVAPKKNGPNALYLNDTTRIMLEPAYKNLEQFLR